MKIKSLIFLLIILYYIQCGKPVPTEDLVKAREEIDIAKEKKIEGESEQFLNKAIEELKNAHSKLPEENYEESKKLANRSFVFSQLSESISYPVHIENLKRDYERKIQEAYDANAEVLAKADYESAKSLYDQAEQENKLKELSLTEEEKNKLATGNYASENEKNKLEQKIQNFVDNSKQVESDLQKALKAANIAYETSISHKEEYFAQINALQDKLNKSKKYKIEKYEPEKTSLFQKEIDDTKNLIQNNQLRIAHQNIEKLKPEIDNLYSIALTKYAEEMYLTAEKELNIVNSKMNSSSEIIEKSDSKDKIQEIHKSANEAYQKAKMDLENNNYESSISYSQETIKLTKILDELVDKTVLAYNKRQVTLNQQNEQNEQNEQKEVTDLEKKEQEIQDTQTTSDDNIKTIHTVKPKEYLWKISGYKHIYNDPRKWKKIYEANKDQIKNPNLIYPKQKLKILKNEK